MKTSPPLTAWTHLQTQNSAPHTIRHGIQGEHTAPQKFTTLTTTQHTRQPHHTLEVLTQTQASTKPSWHPALTIATTFSRTYPSHSIPQTCTAPPVKKHTTSQFPHLTHQSPLLSATTAVPATWGGEGICLRTIRVEDGSLSEISDLFLEVFAGVGIGGSNIILLGSASLLITAGSSGYVFEWLACAKKIVSRWPNVRVCPLVPLWTDCVPGQFIRSLQELSSGFRSLFGSDLRGLNHTWISANGMHWR